MSVEVPHKDIEWYKEIAEEQVEELKEMARDLKGIRVVHLNATSFGGGVAELLYTLVPLMRSLGLDARWEVLRAPQDFFNVTKKFHNALQGADLLVSDEEWRIYEEVNLENAKRLDLEADILVVHDPQPAAVLKFLKKRSKAVWRCHIDLSTPNEEIWSRFKGYVEEYDLHLFHLRDYFPKGFEETSREFPPSIDPLSDKNRPLADEEIEAVLERYKLDLSRPIVTVVARFDPWKDLFSAIDVYRELKREIPVQLAVVSAMAHDDPEGWIFYERVLRYACEDEDIHFLTNLVGVGSKEVNAIQRASTFGLHTATREGFGLVISEMMWKGNPVVARPAGGVRIQVDDGVNGYLRWSVEDLKEASLKILKDEKLRKEMGERAREKVLRNFITTSHLKRYLEVFKELL